MSRYGWVRVLVLLAAGACKAPSAAGTFARAPRQSASNLPDASVNGGSSALDEGSKTLPAATVNSVRKVPWKDRVYDFPDGPTPFVNGRYELLDNSGNIAIHRRITSIVFGDLDRDGREEAFLIVTMNLGGPYTDLTGFLFGLGPSGEPELIAELEGGDRAMGGLESAKIEGGELIVHRFDGDGACCPNAIQVEHWRLVNRGLVLQGRPLIQKREPRPWSATPPAW